MASLAGEGLDHPGAGHVLVHHGGDLGQVGLDHPAQREQLLAHPGADGVDGGQGRHRHQGEPHVDAQHQHHRQGEGSHAHHQGRGVGEEHLHGAHIRVGPGDELAGLHPIVERERQAGEVLVEQGPQVVLELVGDPGQTVACEIAEDGPQGTEGEDPPHEGC